MEFHYKAITREGARTEGFVQAANEKAARSELLEKFGSVLELRRADESGAPRQKPFRVKQELTVVFFRRLGTMVTSGVSWADSLEFMVSSTTDNNLSEAADYLARLVQEGHTLSSAMRSPRLRYVFDPVSIGMVAMGEQTGQLNRIINKIIYLIIIHINFKHRKS